MKPETPQDSFDTIIEELKNKYLPTFRKTSMMFLLIILTSFFASWLWEYINPIEIPTNVENPEAFRKLSKLSNFIITLIALTTIYIVYILSNLVAYNRKSKVALNTMAEKMLENIKKSKNDKKSR